MDNAFILVIATLIWLAFGYMVGRWHGFSDANKVFDEVFDEVLDEVLEEVKDKWAPKRDARGRFIKRK